jgi:hypothetical protein
MRAIIPMPPIAALTPIPAFAPVDNPPEGCVVFVEEPDEVGCDGAPEVVVATFHPRSPIAKTDEDEDTVIEASANPPEKDPRYVRT